MISPAAAPANGEEHQHCQQQHSRHKDCLIIDYFNISEFGGKTKEWLQSDEGRAADIVGLGEHHLNGKKLEAARNWAQQQGLRSTWSRAAWSGRSAAGTTGGAAVLSKKHLHFSSMQIKEGGKEKTVQEMVGLDWAGVLLKLKGVTIFFISAYLTCGIGAAGINVKKLSGMIQKILELGLPFIVAADWNMEPAELEMSGFLHQTGGQIMTPQGVRTTCRSGRLLDYLVVSPRVRPLVRSIQPVMNLPWTTHLGLRLQLRRTTRQAMMRQLCCPKRISDNKEPVGELEDRSSDASWGRPGETYALGIQGKQTNQLEGTVLECINNDAWTAGEQYARWSRKLEDFLLDCQGKSGRQYHGRGQFPKFRVLPAFAKQATSEITPGGKEATMWCSAAARLADWRRALGSTVNCNSDHLWMLENFFWQLLQDVRTHLESLSPVEDSVIFEDMTSWKARLENCLAAAIGNADVVSLASLEEEARGWATKADYRRTQQIRHKVINWVANACDSNMKGAHRWIKKEETFAPDTDELRNGKVAKDMVEVLDQKAEYWSKWWKKEDQEETRRLQLFITELREEAPEEGNALPDITLKQLTDATYHMNNGRQVGCDH